MACRICGGKAVLFWEGKKRHYLRCDECGLIFVPDEFVISPDEEVAEYNKHENSMDDAGYRKFLMRAAQPVMDHFSAVPRKVAGLDFGCGPAPVLASMLCDSDQFDVKVYDLYFFPQEENLESERRYDFITLTEVAEHLMDPLRWLSHLWSLLNVGGIMVVMTKRCHGTVDTFKNWHYIRDPTHITFFSDDTFQWLKRYFENSGHEEVELIFSCSDVVIFKKK